MRGDSLNFTTSSFLVASINLGQWVWGWGWELPSVLLFFLWALAAPVSWIRISEIQKWRQLLWMSSPESRTAPSPTGVPLHVLVFRSNSNRSRISGFQGNPEKKNEIYIIRFAHSWNAATSGEIRAAVQLPHSNTSQQYGRKTEKSNALIINHPVRVR